MAKDEFTQIFAHKSEEELEEIMAEAIFDGEGKINYGEFIRFRKRKWDLIINDLIKTKAWGIRREFVKLCVEDEKRLLYNWLT